MKVVIKAQPSTRANTGGTIRVSCNGHYRVIKAVVFSRKEAVVLKKAADNASIIKK